MYKNYFKIISCSLLFVGSLFLVSCDKSEVNSEDLNKESTELSTMNGGFQIPQEFSQLYLDQDFMDIFELDTALFYYIESLAIEEGSPLHNELNYNVTDIESLETILENYQIAESTEIINILNLKTDKVSLVISKYPSLTNYTNAQIENIIIWNYEKFLPESDNTTYASCYSNLQKARSRCYDDYLLDMGYTAGAMAVASMGTPLAMTLTGALGTAYSLAKYGVCRNRANKDYNECMGN